MNTKSKAVQYGLIGSFIFIILGMVSYLMGASIFKNLGLAIGLGLLSLIIPLIFMILSPSAFKKANGGFITLQEAFREAFIPLVVMVLVGLLFNIILAKIIDPGYAEEVMEMTIDVTEEQLEKAGLSEDQIEKRLEKVRKNDRFAWGTMLKNNAIFTAVYGLFALVIAAIIKKKNPDLA